VDKKANMTKDLSQTFCDILSNEERREQGWPVFA